MLSREADDRAIESSYVSLIASFGLAFVLIYVGVGVVSVVRLYRTIRCAENPRDVALHYGFYFYILAYLVASVSLRLEGAFPSNVFYVLGICISLFLPVGSSVVTLEPRQSPVKRPRRSSNEQADRTGRAGT